MREINIEGQTLTVTFSIVGQIGGQQAFETLTFSEPHRPLSDLDTTLSREILGGNDKSVSFGNRRVKEWVCFGKVTSQNYPNASMQEIVKRYKGRAFYNV